MNLQGPANESVTTGCPHDHLFHESKRHTFCKDCKRRMVRDKGDWKASSESEPAAAPSAARSPATPPAASPASEDPLRRALKGLLSTRT